MKLYWPCAKYINLKGEMADLFTYEGCITEFDASKQIKLWRDGFHFDVREAHIDVYEQGKKVQTIPIIKDGGLIIGRNIK